MRPSAPALAAGTTRHGFPRAENRAPATPARRYGPAPAAAGRSASTARRDHRLANRDLDTDLADWHAPIVQHGRPLIGILGRVNVEAPGRPPTNRQRFYSEVIVYLASRGSRGATADELTEAIWPDLGIANSSRRVAMSTVRRWLGETPDGQLWLPGGLGADRTYRLVDGYLVDWHLFRRLRTRGMARGAAGTANLRYALDLVRGVPFDGADRPHASSKRNPYRWLPDSTIPPRGLASAIVDTAHQLVTLCLEAGDTTTGRWAVEQAWLADPDRTDDDPWVDLMRIHDTDGHTSELRALLEQLIRTRGVEVPEELSPKTFQAIYELVGNLRRLG